MSAAMSLPPKNLLMLAALGIGAYWFVTRKASAATGQGSAKTAGQSFAKSPAANYAQQAGQQSPLATGLNFVTSLLSGGNAATYRAPGYNPTYTPDSAGEAAARDYYLGNQDAFASNPPSSYTSNDGFSGGTGGYLDSQ